MQEADHYRKLAALPPMISFEKVLSFFFLAGGIVLQLWSAIATALISVTVGPLVGGEVRGALLRRLTSHASLRQSLKGHTSALRELDALISIEAAELRARETHRLTRKVDWSSVGALVVVGIVGGVIVFGLVTWAISVSETPIAYWGLILLAVVVGVFTVALAGVGMNQLFVSTPDSNKSKDQTALVD